VCDCQAGLIKAIIIIIVLLQDRIEVAERSHRAVISDYLNVIQQLSTCEGSSHTELRRQVKQLTQQVDEYRDTIRQHVTEAASAKVRNLKKRFLSYFVEICFDCG